MTRTIVVVLISTVLLETSATVLSGNTCLECHEIIQPRHCDTAVTCPVDHYCGTEKVQTRSGSIAYNVGCRHKSVCAVYMNQTTLTSQSFSPCLECCQGSMCNANSCGEPGYPDIRGPICYECKNYNELTKCDHIAQCSTDEVCYIDQRLEYGDLLYTSGCKLKHSCTNHVPLAGSANFVGRRFLDSHMTPAVCAMCCDQDVCNGKCDKDPNVIKTSSSTIPSTAVTTPTSSSTIPSTTVTTPTTKTTTARKTARTTTIAEKTTSIVSTVPPISSVHDCRDIYESGYHTTGVYNVSVNVSGQLQSLQVYCDMDTPGGGWTVFQRRFDGSVDFYRNLSEYESGFGVINGEFWLGLKWVHWMTVNSASQMMINMTDAADGRESYAKYGTFSLGPGTGYRLHVIRTAGTAGIDRLSSSWHNDQDFTTYDHDVDQYTSVNCAILIHAGFWFNHCNAVNLNGHYGGDYAGKANTGLYWTSGIDRLSSSWHNDQDFTTYDHDVDQYTSVNCAILRHAGFWFNHCSAVNLNGHYGGDYNGQTDTGLYWIPYTELRTSQMAFRRVS